MVATISTGTTVLLYELHVWYLQPLRRRTCLCVRTLAFAAVGDDTTKTFLLLLVFSHFGGTHLSLQMVFVASVVTMR